MGAQVADRWRGGVFAALVFVVVAWVVFSPTGGELLASGTSAVIGPVASRTAAATASPSPPPAAQRVFSELPPATRRVLAIMVDNRAPVAGEYPGLAAVATHAWATAHGYEFRYYRAKAFTHANVEKRFGADAPEPPPPSGSGAKDATTAYHPGLRRYRAASWAKILVAWYLTAHAAEEGGWDAVIFFDSDACAGNLGLSLPAWVALSAGAPVDPKNYGTTVANSSIAFYGNLPYAWPEHPIAGWFAWVPGPRTAAFFRDWWNVHDGKFGFKHAYEQFGLWALMERGWGRDVMAVHNRGHMTNDDPDGFVRHWGSDRASSRVDQLTQIVSLVPGLQDPAAVAARLEEIARGKVVEWDPLEYAGELMAASAAAGDTTPSALMPPDW